MTDSVPLTPKALPLLDQIAGELSLPASSVGAVIALLSEGGTVPFIARYRKERTGGLDEVQIRAIEERREYLGQLDARRQSIEKEIGKQGKLTEELQKRLLSCTTKAELEDLYAPYKPKRRTKAMIAKERGLEPLADLIWGQPLELDLNGQAERYAGASDELEDASAALAGARDILAERIAEDAELRGLARARYLEEGTLQVEKTAGFADKVTKFDSYDGFTAPLGQVLSHQYLAVRRGESEGVLRARLVTDEQAFIEQVERKTPLDSRSPCVSELKVACRDAVQRHLLSSASMDVRVELKMRSDKQAVDVFATNLRELLMAAPLGRQAVLGIDPGQRTGCKLAVVDTTGKLLEHDTIYLVQGEAAVTRAREQVLAICARHPIFAIAVGNGTHGRETEGFIRGLFKDSASSSTKAPLCVSVSESGASVYSASEIAREEFPDLDLTVRGAVSIARRLQDPLSELVKIDPKSIGVGQYQHDVFQSLLTKKLDEVVESCVHEVGVELNTASAPLLARVSGLGPSLAKRIVEQRNASGPYKCRKDLLSVSGLGPRAFEQAAGFLRIRDADNPLDGSAVHPERYELVEAMARDLGVPVQQLIGSRDLLKGLKREKYLSENVGEFTLDDIVAELLKPGRDPRDAFEPPAFRDDVSTVADLTPGMSLEGVVTNVTAFGAFVDVGVHQDGLVHISRLADRFVKDPSEVVKVGQKLTVRVLEVDLERQRISLSARRDDVPVRPSPKDKAAGDGAGRSGARPGGSPNGQRSAGRSGSPGSGKKHGTGGSSRTGTSSGQLTHNPFARLVRN